MKTVLVTGATRGLGLAITTRLIHDGFRVVATGRADTHALQNLRADFPNQIAFEPFDLAEVNELQAFVHAINKTHGPIFGLVNNAAVGIDGVLGTMHNTDIERVLRINVLAPMILTKYVVRAMMVCRQGRVINISSIIASTGFSGLTAYAGSKAAMEGFTKSLAREVGRFEITVNTVAPGFMETEMTASLKGDKLQTILRRSPLRRLAAPQDAAAAVAFLLSPDAASVTGTSIKVDAGSTC
ncbi:MAG TPA: SDR family oxidoreductase [Sphingomicrobium sp.]|jgi:3-oxoacyl-[acyl-carrier protein] reductase|nr:SDR family oxidoreductase [Sphingomicrobium sp.]